MKKNLTVGEVADILGVTTTTLRNWDKSGKLVPERNPNNKYRLYKVEDVNSILAESDVSYLPFSEKELTTEEELKDAKSIRKLIRKLSAAFRNSSGGGLIERFEEISKLLFTKLYDEQQIAINKNYSSVFRNPKLRNYKNVNQLYSEAASQFESILLNGRGSLGNDKRAATEAIEILSKVNLAKVQVDVKGTAFEELIKNTFEKSENQQFFTPRTIVDFMIQLFPDDSKNAIICDPACGSGGFLIEALKNYNSKIKICGFEVDKRMAWVAQMNLSIHGGSNDCIKFLDGDGSLGFSNKVSNNIPKSGFDFIITNPPFGSDFSNQSSLSKFELGKGKSNRRRGVLFVERCIKWLKPKTGKLAIILDDSILNGAANSDVRELILNNCNIDAIVSLPESSFKPYASVETSILLLTKKASNDRSDNSDVFMAKANVVGRRNNGDFLYRRSENGELVLDNDLDEILKGWESLRQGKRVKSELFFICKSKKFKENMIENNRLDFQFHHPIRDKAQIMLQKSNYKSIRLKDLIEVRNETVNLNLLDPLSIWRFVGLANIESINGRYDVSQIYGNQLKSSVKRFKQGDIVFSKMRPELRKSFLATDSEEAYSSGECIVLTVKRKDILYNAYLSLLLRSDIVYGQIVYQISGTGRPRISSKALMDVLIPIPPLSTQKKMVKAYEDSEQKYFSLIEKSKLELQKANNVMLESANTFNSAICN